MLRGDGWQVQVDEQRRVAGHGAQRAAHAAKHGELVRVQVRQYAAQELGVSGRRLRTSTDRWPVTFLSGFYVHV